MAEAYCDYSCSSIMEARPRPLSGAGVILVRLGTATARSVQQTSIVEFYKRLYLDQYSATAARWLGVPVVVASEQGATGVEALNREQRDRNAEAVALLGSWLADESGYDAEVWPTLQAAVEKDRLSDRKRFADG